MAIETKYRSEYVLFNGLRSYTGTTQYTSDAVNLEGIRQYNLCIVSQVAGAYVLEFKVNGQWIVLASGSYAALTPLILYSTDNIPAEIRLKITNATSGKLFAALRPYGSRVETYESSSVGTLAWATPLSACTYTAIGRTGDPTAILYDVSGHPLAVQSGVATPASTPALMVAGSDGTNSRYMTVDSSGRSVVVGAGSVGTPVGGVLSVQGVVGGIPVGASSVSVAIGGSLSTFNAGALITDAAWYANSGALTVGKSYELWIRGGVLSDILELTWWTNATGVAPGSSVIGRAVYLNSPIIIVPDTGHTRVLIRATDLTALGAISGAGYYAQLVPCQV